MSFRDARTLAGQYILIGIVLTATWFLSSRFNEAIGARIMAIGEGAGTLFVLFSVVIVFTVGFVVYELAKPTILPSFVLAIFFGIVSRDVLASLVDSPVAISTLITIGAILILFGGGLDTPFQKFKDHLGPILSLAIVGTVINAFLLSLLIVSIAAWAGVAIPLGAVVLLGAALASTDPAAIIPSLQSMLFTKPRVKHIAISESAINDVVSAVLATVFLTLLTQGVEPSSVMEAYGLLLTWENAKLILHTVLIGASIGLVGFGILHLWSNWKARVQTEDESDAALLLGVPIFAFTISQLLGGSGFLSVFLAGLLFHMRAHFRHVEHYFNHTIEGFMKPMIFMLLGAMADPAALVEVAPLGIVVGLLFMFVLRPLTVFISLFPFCFGKKAFDIKELLFLSFVRETGVIPAALLITVRVAQVPGSDTIMAVGLWVILLTLIIEPPLTPLVAKKLSVARDIPVLPRQKHHGPVAVLCSRGYSFPERMQTVVDWAKLHSVENIVLLHCPEEKYTPEFIADVRDRANKLFAALNHKQETDGLKEINFEFLCGPGLLQENIEKLIADGDVSIIFVGSKMLDYRMEDVKRLSVPFYFMG